MWSLIGLVNIIGGMITLLVLTETDRRYIMGPRMNFYLELCFISMFLLIFTQVITLMGGPGDWKLKIGSVFWWGRTLYFAWAIRFSSLKR